MNPSIQFKNLPRRPISKVNWLFFHDDKVAILPSKQSNTHEKCLTLIYLMAGFSSFFTKVTPYFDTIKATFDSEAMLENEDFDSSLKILAKVAVNLFNHNEQITSIELVETLEDDHLQLSLNTLLLRRIIINS